MTYRTNEQGDGPPLPNGYCSPEQIIKNAECLLGRIEEVQAVLRRKHFSENAIDQGITALYGAAMAYITGTRPCEIKNRRAWAFKVAIRAALRAAKREFHATAVEPEILAETVSATRLDAEPCALSKALKQLSKRQSDAVELCILEGMSQRAAAKKMGIKVSTLREHLSAAMARLKDIVPPPSGEAA